MESSPCGTLKTLSVSFSPPAIPPANGYKVRWRIAGDVWINVPNQYNNPITIAGVPACFNLEVGIQADCGNGNTGPEIIAGVTGSVTTCYQFILLDTANYTYVPCGSTTPVTVTSNSATPVEVCAVDGTVTGGSFTRTVACIV